MAKRSGQSIFLGAVLLGGGLLVGYLFFFYDNPADARLTLADIPFNGARAFEYLNKICAIGPRQSGSAGMESQQKLLGDHFQQLGGAVSLQRFRARHPLDGTAVNMANMLVQWHPDRNERILLCAHYDTRPFPDRDPVNPRGTFVGANDGASGAAVLMELAHLMPQLKGRYGVDFVLFDGEELVYGERDPYFLGSEIFSQEYVNRPPAYKYVRGVLLDMVGDADLRIMQERNSMSWRDTRPIVVSIWDTARRLGVQEFIAQKGHQVNDDHLRLHGIAKIPTCDIIDFDYPHWHTAQDTPDKCSALSLAKVGWVINEWLKASGK